MEDIKKEKNFHMYFMVSIVLAMFMEIYAFLMRLNLLNIFIFISFIFYLWNQNHKKKQQAMQFRPFISYSQKND